jgi:class 3 adenylate cyclase
LAGQFELPRIRHHRMARHDEILRDAVESHRGMVFSEMGDGMAAAFASAGDALAAVLDAQLGLGSFEWGATGPLRARMGLHAGEGALRELAGVAVLNGERESLAGKALRAAMALWRREAAL